jgi:hypothetical protein
MQCHKNSNEKTSFLEKAKARELTPAPVHGEPVMITFLDRLQFSRLRLSAATGP